MRLRTWILAMTSLTSVACGGSGRHAPAPATNVITQVELDAAGSATVYDVVVRTHPSFLRVRGPTSIMSASARTQAAVFMEDHEYGGFESLKSFPAGRVREIRFYSGPEAATKFGSEFGAGVIQLRMRVQ